MSWKLKLFTVFNAVGWLVVVPILAGALLDPFVDFRNWPGGSIFDSNRSEVRIAEPQENRQGSRRSGGSGSLLSTSGSTTLSASGGTVGARPEARPGLQNRLVIDAGTVANGLPFVLRDSASFANGRAPGADRLPAAAPTSPTSAPPLESAPPSARPPIRAADRPEAPAAPTKDSGPTALSEGPSGEEPNVIVDPEPVATVSSPTVEVPEAPSAPEPVTEPDSGTTTPPPPPDDDDEDDEDDDGGKKKDHAVQPKEDCPEDDGPGNGKGNGNGND